MSKNTVADKLAESDAGVRAILTILYHGIILAADPGAIDLPGRTVAKARGHADEMMKELAELVKKGK